MFIQTLKVEDATFYICKDPKTGYWGIHEKYVDADGRVKQEINGLEGNHADNYVDTVRHCWLNVKALPYRGLWDKEDLSESVRLCSTLIDEFEQLGVTEAWQNVKHISMQ